MLGNVLPGVRELRAPLAGGYLWLVFAWVVWGDKLPSKGAEKADALDRLYRLEPIISSIGLVVVASVAAYIVGSIAIDVQTGVGRRIADLVVAVVDRTFRRERWQEHRRLSLTAAGNSMLAQWEHARADELRREFSDKAIAAARQLEELAQKNRQELDDAEIEGLLRMGGTPDREPESGTTHHAPPPPPILPRRGYQYLDVPMLRYVAVTLSFSQRMRGSRRMGFSRPPEVVERATREYIFSNRDLLKTRLNDVSQPLHSDFDRPDAEATFRMALWPPLAALVIYLTREVSWWWVLAVVVPVLLAWQWISLRRRANSALVAAFVARDALGGPVAQWEVRKRAIRKIREEMEWDWRTAPEYLREYEEAPPPPPTRPPSAAELRGPGDLGARPSDGQSTEEKDDVQPEEQQEPG